MKKLILISLAFILISCGPSPEEMATVAQVTCNIMAETKNMDGALRIKEINAAREKLGMPAFLGSDDVIKQSFEYGLCTSLVLNNDNDYRDLLTSAILKGVKEAEEEEARLAEEARARDREQQRIAMQVEARRLARPDLARPDLVARDIEFRVAETIRTLERNVQLGFSILKECIAYNQFDHSEPWTEDEKRANEICNEQDVD